MPRPFVFVVMAAAIAVADTTTVHAVPTLMTVFGLDTAPHDLAITPDGTQAVVRAGVSLEGITFYDLATGALTVAAESTSASLGVTSVEVTDTRAVILSGATLVLESVEFWDLSVSPVAPMVFHSLGTAPYDAAITPDGTKVVVRTGATMIGKGVIIYDMASGAELASFPTATASLAVRAVETTDTRAVVLGGAGPIVESVEVFDLTTAPPSSLAVISLMTAPWDVALTPDGTKAVVRAGAVPAGDGIVVVDMASGAMLTSFGTMTASFAVRAVACTDTRAIVLGGAGALAESVNILDLTDTPPSSMATFDLATAPMDVVITPDGTKAVVRAGASADAITIYELATASLLTTIASTTAFGGVKGVEVTDERAVTLGGAGPTDSVRVIDLTTSPPTSMVEFALGIAPHDVAITPDTTQAVVRGGGAGADTVTFYDLTPAVQTAVFGTTTGPMAVELVKVTDTRAVVVGGAGPFTESVEFFDLSTIPGDCDGDGDVDLTDYATYEACATGPDAGPIGVGCACVDFDTDDDVDLIDYGMFQFVYTGPLP